MQLLPELEFTRNLADCGDFSGRRSDVDAMTAELGEGAGTAVEGDRSSAESVFVDEHMFLSEEGVAVCTAVDGPKLEVDFRDRSVSCADCLDVVYEGARRTQCARGLESKSARFEVDGFDDGERLRRRSLRCRRSKGE